MTHSGDSSGSDGSTTKIIVQKIPLPDWVRALNPLSALLPVVGALRAFGDKIREKGSIRGAILSTVLAWAVAQIFQVTGIILESILLAVDPLLRAIGTSRDALMGAFSTAGQSVISVMIDVNQAVADVTGVAGPAAPIITATAATVSLYLTYRLLASIAGEFPVLSTITDFFGLP